MDYKKLSIYSWKELEKSGNVSFGYRSMWLSDNDQEAGLIHIFQDEKSNFHLAIEVLDSNPNKIEDPAINGLTVQLKKYRLDDEKVSSFIDIQCNLQNYLKEFTEVSKEITRNIVEGNENPYEVVARVIRNWKSFWANKNTNILSEEQIIGLICELKVLQRFILINKSNALKTWTGPSGEKHDFNFTDWSLEVKGTRSADVIHTVNGIDQLKCLANKKLGFISFLISVTDTNNSVSLPGVIEDIKVDLVNRPDLIIFFYQLLAQWGYSPIHADDYNNFKIEILESTFFEVNDLFPSLTSDKLNAPLNNRITSVRYDISLEGLAGRKFDEVNLGEYFY